MMRVLKISLLLLIIFTMTRALFHHFLSHDLMIELPIISKSLQQIPQTKKILDTIKKGETLSALLIRNGIASTQLVPFFDSFKKLYSVHRLKPGDNYVIETDSSGKLVSFTYSPSIEKKYHVYTNGNGEYLTQETKINLTSKIKYLTGNIESTLYEAILKAGETPELLFLFTDIFQWDIDFFIDPRIGDRFKIVYEKFCLPETDEFVRYGKILASQYISAVDTFTALYFDNRPGDDGYYDLDGKSFQKTFLKSPLNYRRISSYFSYSRRHPILKIYRPHYGIDYSAPAGTPVSAAADGAIIDKGYDKSIGNFIKMRHKNARFMTVYGHLSRFEPGINKGDGVKQRQVIGYVGSTGLSTGPHLHYAFYDNGRPFDPLRIKNTAGDPILPDNQARFHIVKEAMLTQLDEVDKHNVPLMMLTSQQVHYNRYSIPAR